jgi:hypothetical protein
MSKKIIFSILLCSVLILSCNKNYETNNNETQEIEIVVEEPDTPVQNQQNLDNAHEVMNITDILNVRDLPSMSGKIIQKSLFGDIFPLYDKKGTGMMENGVVDLWYKISETEEKWVNAFYVRQFPFYIASDSVKHLKDNNDYRIDRSTVIVRINGYEVKDGIKYVEMDVSSVDDNNYRFANETSRIEPIMEVYDIFNEKVPLIDSTFNNIIELRYDIIDYKKDEAHASVAYIWKEGYETWDYELSSLVLKYGIRAGMPFNDVCELLGDYYYFDDYEGAYIYSNLVEFGHGTSIFKIMFYLDKQNIIDGIVYRYPVIK